MYHVKSASILKVDLELFKFIARKYECACVCDDYEWKEINADITEVCISSADETELFRVICEFFTECYYAAHIDRKIE